MTVQRKDARKRKTEAELTDNERALNDLLAEVNIANAGPWLLPAGPPPVRPGLKVVPDGPCFAVVQRRSFIAWQATRELADALLERLEFYPEVQWHGLIPDPFSPCFFGSVYHIDGAARLAGADAWGLPVAIPLSIDQWDAFEARHPDRPMPFSAYLSAGLR
ncbi:MAG: hypothetical protein O7G88_08255 [bacterium]|nr:hypothetical protein [bacterium]